MLNIYKKLCAENLGKFKKAVLPIEPIQNGIAISEGFAFCIMGLFTNINIIIESGTAGGRSTEIFAKFFNFPIYTIDNYSIYGENRQKETEKRLSIYKNISFINGDSNKEIPRILNNLNGSVGIFIDGPKATKAYNLASILLNYSNVKFIGIHDTCLPNRYHDMDILGNIFFYTDENWFYEKYKDMIDDTIYNRGAGIGFKLNTEKLDDNFNSKQ